MFVQYTQMFGGILGKTQSEGVSVVGGLTVLIGLAFLAFGYVGFVLNGLSDSIPAHVYPGLVISMGGGVLLLVDSVFIFRGKRAGYLLSIILWVLILAAIAWWIVSLGVFGLLIAPLVYCVTCLTYFSTKNVRTYFGT